MSNYEIGDLVVLTAGSMRMAVESVEGDRVACVWCHEGQIGRDGFDARLLKKWEHREEDRGSRLAAKPYRRPGVINWPWAGASWRPWRLLAGSKCCLSSTKPRTD